MTLIGYAVRSAGLLKLYPTLEEAFRHIRQIGPRFGEVTIEPIYTMPDHSGED